MERAKVQESGSPCASPLYIGVEGSLAKGEEGNPSFPFPTDRYPPFSGILILSLRDMILFLVKGNLDLIPSGYDHIPCKGGSSAI
jgi:hypothetical protein